MDLKGSLTDTNLRIFPTVKLIEFLKKIEPADHLPHNILHILKSNSKTSSKIYSLPHIKPVQLNEIDIENIKKYKEVFDGKQMDEPIENSYNESKEKKREENKVTLPNIECDIKDKITKEKLMITTDVECKDEENNDSEISLKRNLNQNNIENKTKGPFLVTSDIDWLYEHIKSRRNNGEKDIPYLHVLLQGVSIEVPDNELIKRNPVLEARCVKLRAQQEAREYRKMTKSVDNVRMRFPEDNISYQLKQLNRQLIAIGQFLISIFAGFLFGFRGVEWMVGNLDFGFRLLLGVMCALVIALAEIYFLAKKLNEELCVPDTVQLGGPVKFADQEIYANKNNEKATKQHQD